MQRDYASANQYRLRHLRHSRRGVTLTDLAVLLAAAAMLLALFLAGARRAAETNDRIKCAANLKQIGQGMIIYASNNKGIYPRGKTTPGGPLTQFTGVNAAKPFAPDGPGPNDVTACLYMLVRETGLSLAALICPSSAATTMDLGGKSTSAFCNFPSDKNLSYGVSNPFPSQAAVEAGYRYNTNVVANFALAADMSSGNSAALALTADSPPEQMAAGNSNNHAGDGQNVLYNDGHVEWNNNPFVGIDRDNIYTAAATDPARDPSPMALSGKARQQKIPAASIAGDQPQADSDSVVLPASTLPRVGLLGTAGISSGTSIALVVGSVVAVLAIVGLTVFVLMRKRKTPVRPETGASLP